jgi:hypothetical protein
MSETKALVVQEMSLSDTMTLGETLAESGFFADAKQAAQAVVKVLAGRELGFGPIASMTGIHIVNGKPSLGANLIAAKVKGSGRYTYRIVTLDNVRCELAIFENGAELQPRSLFTMEDAVTAGLTTGKNAHSWRHYPRNMLFARAISNAARWHCPELFSGNPVYTPEEMGAQVDGDGDIIDLTPTVTEPTPATDSTPSNGEHWLDKLDRNGTPLRVRFWTWARQDLGLHNDQVHKALEVESVKDYTGTMGDAKDAITKWIAKQADGAQDELPMTEEVPA